MKKKIIEIIPIFVILIFAGIFFRQTFLSGKLPIPSDTLVGMYHPWLDFIAKEYPAGMPFKNFLITDPIRQQIPWRKLAIDSIKIGNWNPWNAFSFSGTPLLTNIQSGLFYPFNFLFLILPFPIAWTILIMLQPILAGVFLYFFLKVSVRLSGYASLFGALCFMFCGFSISWLTWGTIGQTILWLPLALVLSDILLTASKNTKIIGMSIVLALTFTMQYFAGHSQVFLYSMIVFSAYALSRIVLNSLTLKNKTKAMLWLCLSFIIFAVLTFFHWVQFFSELGSTSRLQEVGLSIKEGFFIPFQHIIQFIIPDFFGNPATLNYWGVWNYGEFIGYIGVVGLFFVLYSFFGNRRKQTFFWLAIVIIGSIFAFPTAVAKFPYTMHIPFFSSLQPTRLLSIVDFSLCILAAIGLDTWLNNQKERYSVFIGIVTAVLFGIVWYIVKFNPYKIVEENLGVANRNIIFPTVIFGLVMTVIIGRIGIARFFRKENQLVKIIPMAFLIGIAFFDLTRFGWKFTPFTDQKLFFPKTEIIEFLEEQPKPFRITSVDDRIMPPNVSSFYGIESIAGYDPLYNSRYEKFIAAMERGEPNITAPYGFNRIITPKNISSPLFRLLGVRFVLSLSDISNPGFRKVMQEGQTRVYEYMDILPRIRLLENVLLVKDEKKIIEMLYSPLFQLVSDGIVEDELRIERGALSAAEKAVITQYSGTRIDISVSTDKRRMLFVGNMFHQNWKTYVDGVKTPVVRVDYIFMGIVIPPGTHTVQVRYE